MTAQVERLDYAIRARGPSNARLLLQHMCIAYDIATDPNNLTAYTSDHLPVRVDLDLDRPPRLGADRQADPDAARRAGPDGQRLRHRGPNALVPRRRARRLKIQLTQGGPRVHLDVYTADNLSVPVRPFSTLDDPATHDQAGNTRFALPSAPFFLRVSLPDRRGEAAYEIRLHRYAGTGWLDAIPLLRGVTETGEAKVGAPHSLDNPATSFSEHDTVWFVAPFDTYPDGSLPASPRPSRRDPAAARSATRCSGGRPAAVLSGWTSSRPTLK